MYFFYSNYDTLINIPKLKLNFLNVKKIYLSKGFLYSKKNQNFQRVSLTWMPKFVLIFCETQNTETLDHASLRQQSPAP